MTAGPTSQPDPDAHGAHPSAPRRPHRLPRRTARTLQVACKRQNPSHQALPLSNVPARPQHGGRGAPSSAGGSAKARLPATLHLPPLPHAQQHPCRGRPLLPSDTSSPQTSTFQAFLFPPQGHGPIPLHQAALPLQPPSLHLPSPGAGQQGHSETGLWGPAGRNGAGEGPQGSLFVAPVSPGGRGRGHGRSALTNLFPRTAGPTRKTGPRGRTGRGTQGARATDTHQPPQLCPPPSTERKAEIIPQKRKQSNQVRPNPIK